MNNQRLTTVKNDCTQNVLKIEWVFKKLLFSLEKACHEMSSSWKFGLHDRGNRNSVVEYNFNAYYYGHNKKYKLNKWSKEKQDSALSKIS